MYSPLVIQLSVTQLVALLSAAFLTLYSFQQFIIGRLQRKSCPLPPGPLRLPILGNMLSINLKKPWLTFTEWGDKYGDVVYTTFFGDDIIVLNTFSAARDLLEKRSNIYSNRPLIATVEPFGLDAAPNFAQYTPQWRLCRRMIHYTYRADPAFDFRPVQLRRAREMITNLSESPAKFSLHCLRFAATEGLSAIYDYEAKSDKDPMLATLHDFYNRVAPEIISEKALVLKCFPLLANVPEWVPALSWMSRQVSELRAMSKKFIDMPFEWVQKRAIANEDITPDTMVFEHIRRAESMKGAERAEYENLLKISASTALFAAADMTGSTLRHFTRAMVTNPHVWKRAQAELDQVVGTDRLPEFEDRSSLPYVEAIMRETFRWKPVAPLGIPHAASTNDFYNGYHIPSGATVIPNIWAMSRDESRYPDPEAFYPDRFLDSDGALTDDDPAQFVFGFGRRSCPGRYPAVTSVWSAIATMLATIEFNKAKDANGNEIEPDVVDGDVSNAYAFPCTLTLRAHVTKEFLQDSQ